MRLIAGRLPCLLLLGICISAGQAGTLGTDPLLSPYRQIASGTVNPAPGTLDDIVVVANAWIREMDADEMVTAGYMTLVNVSGAPVQLVALKSPGFERIEIHDMVQVDGRTKRRVLTPLDLPSGGLLVFSLGPPRITLMDPRYPIYEGKVVPVTLIFASGREQTIRVQVARDSPGPINLARQ